MKNGFLKEFGAIIPTKILGIKKVFTKCSYPVNINRGIKLTYWNTIINYYNEGMDKGK
jgi:hypothetical protein